MDLTAEDWDELQGDRWLCPNCGALRRKTQIMKGGERYHSWKCKDPMIRVKMTLERL
jgi:hypothetical protein